MTYFTLNPDEFRIDEFYSVQYLYLLLQIVSVRLENINERIRKTGCPIINFENCFGEVLENLFQKFILEMPCFIRN